MSGLEVMRTALARWDAGGISRASALLEGARGALEQRLGALWVAWLRGDAASEDEAHAIAAEASQQRCADILVDATSTRALLLQDDEHLDEALAVARRAARMAATEALPGPRALGSLVLARVRAAAGQSVHATRILESLAGWAPSPWAGWIACERLLVGGSSPAPLIDDDAPSRSARALDDLLSAAARGERDAVLAHARALEPAPVLRRRVRAALGLLDPSIAPESLEVAVAEFVRGEGAFIPLGLTGLGAPREGDAAVWILRRPGRPGRRVARLGLPLTGVPPMPATQRRTGREDAALALLALAPDDGVPYRTLFRRVYRAAYVPEQHDATLRVLAHRIGARLGSFGRVQAGGAHLTLSIDAPLLVPDPRCALRPEDRVLHALARRGRASARELASELDVPLRTVQSAIRELVEDGACREEPHGRSVHYIVEDTTYSEPTRS